MAWQPSQVAARARARQIGPRAGAPKTEVWQIQNSPLLKIRRFVLVFCCACSVLSTNALGGINNKTRRGRFVEAGQLRLAAGAITDRSHDLLHARARLSGGRLRLRGPTGPSPATRRPPRRAGPYAGAADERGPPRADWRHRGCGGSRLTGCHCRRAAQHPLGLLDLPRGCRDGSDREGLIRSRRQAVPLH